MSSIQLPDGSQAEAISVDFDHLSEPWGEYELDDGTTLKVRTVVQDIRRIGAGDHQQGDEPIYHVQSNTVVRTVEVPDHLKTDETGTTERGVE